MMRGVVIEMNDKTLAKLAQLRAFLEGARARALLITADGGGSNGCQCRLSIPDEFFIGSDYRA